MNRPATLFRFAVPAASRSTPSELSREVDALLDELDVVLQCRCCLPRDGFPRIDDWASEVGFDNES
jgi:hypothetical protein